MSLRRIVPIASSLLCLALAGCGGGSSSTPVAPASAAPLTLTSFAVSGGEQDVIPPAGAAYEYTPDEHMSFLQQSDGTYKLWASGGGTNGVYLFRTPDFLTLGASTTVFQPAGAGSTAFDADYAGSGSIIPAANGSDLLMIYHAENHLYSGIDYPGTPFYASIGLARSQDGGVTWQRQGQIIAGHDPQQPTQTASGAGALTPSAIESGGYIYVVFRETDVQSGVSGYAVARAPIASDGAPGSWLKWYQGSYSAAGLGGTFTPLNIVLDPSVPGDERQPDVSFNTYLHAFVMATVGNGGIYVLTSPDLVTWSTAIVGLAAPEPDATAGSTNGPRNWYPTLITPNESSDRVTGQTGYVYYAKFTGDGTSHHYMYRQAFTITGH